MYGKRIEREIEREREIRSGCQRQRENRERHLRQLVDRSVKSEPVASDLIVRLLFLLENGAFGGKTVEGDLVIGDW